MRSIYNEVLLDKALELAQFVKGERKEVDLSGFKEASAKYAEEHPYIIEFPTTHTKLKIPKAGRSSYLGKASVVTLESGKPFVVGSNQAPIVAIGNVLGALNYRGDFYLTGTLRLTRADLSKEDNYLTNPKRRCY